MIQRFDDFVSLINTAYKGLQKIKSYEVEELGLKGNHVMCLFYLGQNEGGLTSGELCEKCREDKAAISRNLKFLQEKGYVTVAGDKDKKYKLKNVLTDKGQEVYSRLEIIIGDAVNKFGKGLTAAERKAFYKALGVIVGNFDAFCDKLDN
ncbi:MAG: winged helix-turn-helix transcriptional regulator [Clostridia bacterium]|nr:winged helix-turn-helix transcriptional regulator [Clostridia bacterium]